MPKGPLSNQTVAPQTEKRPFKETWGRLIGYCKDYWASIIIAILCAVIGTVCTIVGPDKLSEMTDIITQGLVGSIDLEAIARIGVVLAMLYLGSFVLSYLQGYIMATITQHITKNMRTDISKKINVLPLKYFDTTSHGDILSRVSNDVDTISQTLNQSIGSLVSAVVLFFGALFMMFKTSVPLAFAAVISTLAGFALMIVILMKSQGFFTKQQVYLGKINGHIEEVYSGHHVVKAYNASASFAKTYDDLNDELYDVTWKAQFMSGLMMPIMSFIGNFSYVVVCIVGAMLAMEGTITFGVIVAFMVYVRLFSQPLSTIAQSMGSLQQTSAASYRIFEILDEQELVEESHKERFLDKVEGNISFEDVYFSYVKEKPIIKGFSTDVLSGQKVAIVGPTGAGKTTLVNLLMRFYETDSGDIKIDGTSIKDMSREEVHEAFCMVLQDTWLFEGTIRENMIYNQEGITEEALISASKAAGIHHFIMTLPDGYDTVLNEDVSLSQGQKQLITIARAMIQNAPMLILDEATSSVDTRTEILIQDAMDSLMVGRTSIIIAHRLSTIKNADLILVLDKGDVVEKGNHDSLMDHGGLYADLYNSQFENS